MNDITAINRMLRDRVHAVCEHLLPKGVKQGRDWCVGSTAGEPGSSLKVCLTGNKVGLWADFAPGGETGDLIDLWAIVKGVKLAEALQEIRDWLGIKAPEFEREERKYRRPDKPKCTAPANDVRDYLMIMRRITANAINAYQVGEDGRTIVWRYYLPDGALAFVKYQGIDRLAGDKKQIRAEADCEPVLFGWQAIPDNTREVTISEGEADALSFYDYGRPALSVPFGGGKGAKQQWIEREFERLSRFETIYLGLDMDKEGELACEEIASRLGRHRCKRLKLPRKDANQCMQDRISRAEMDAVFASAEGLDPPELRRSGEYADEVVRLFHPVGEVEKGYRLPFSALQNRMIFRPAELTLWGGSTGAGKSQVLSHSVVGFIDQGARICIASLEMKPAQLIRRMVKQAGNVDHPTEQFIREIVGWMDRSVWVFDLVGKAAVARILEVFEYARAKYGCDVFVLDSLMRLGIGSEDYEGQEKAVYEIVSWAVQSNCHVHLVAHSRKSDRQGQGVPDSEDIKGASEIGANAFNIIMVWRNKKLEDEIKALSDKAAKYDKEAEQALDGMQDRPTVILNVSKNRNGDYDGKTGLWFNSATYQYRCATDHRMGVNYVQLGLERAAAE